MSRLSCETIDRCSCGMNRIEVLKENQSEMKIVCGKAGRAYTKIRIDGCCFNSGENCQRCDWGVIMEDDSGRSALFVELKGSDLSHAVKQLKASIKDFLAIYRELKIDSCHIVMSGAIPSTAAQQHKKDFRKISPLHIKRTPHRYAI